MKEEPGSISARSQPREQVHESAVATATMTADDWEGAVMRCTFTKEGCFVGADERWEDLGYGARALIGTDWLSLIHDSDQATCAAAFRDVAHTDMPRSLRALTKKGNGGYTWAQWSFVSLGDDTIAGVVRDTGREHAEMEQYRLGVEAAPIGLLMVDAAGLVTLANQEVHSMFGYSSGELLGKSVDMLVPTSVRSAHHGLRNSFHTAPSKRLMGSNRDLFPSRKDGSEFAIEIGLNPLVTASGIRVLASVVDITERRKREQELGRRVAELQRYKAEMDLLSEMSSLLQQAINKDEAYGVVDAFAERLLPSTTGAIYTYSDSGGSLDHMSSWGPGSVDESFAAVDCWGLRRHSLHRSDGAPPRCCHGATGTGWQTCIPMSARDQPSGVISLWSPVRMEEDERRDMERAGKAVADQLALTLSHLELRETLREQSIRDPLAGLVNRRHLEEAARRELERARRKKSLISVLMIDVDHFKRFNDTQGHQLGDRVLRELGALIIGGLRGEDIACRYGGDEILVVFSDCRRDVAMRRAHELQKELSATNLDVTLSIGVAEWPTDGASWEIVLRKADGALYLAKEKGRDRVCSAADASQT